MNKDEMKRKAAMAALEYIDDYDMVIGVGTGSTVNHFIDLLPQVKNRIDFVVSSSDASTIRLKTHGIQVMELNSTGNISVYIDGADECDPHNRLIKGGGGALTREKIIAAASEKFICIVDDSKMVDLLGEFPLPIEVIPMARSYVGRQLLKMGGRPIYREGFVTDNGNWIIDVHNFKTIDPVSLETKLNNISGAITNGLFAHRCADITLIASKSGVTKQIVA
ncbi:MAG: ribose-5-phosphate isomerase RpiA [Proteobacteria bacterium]|nr:ribose-5-phosphate isomerase RpiA [Pseudomonadota bacterium]